MRMEKLKDVVYKLDLEERKTIYSMKDGTEIFVYRPKKPSSTLKHSDYEPSKNFQIFLHFPDKKEFRPNHLRLLLDLYLKRESDKTKSNIHFNSLEDIYLGEDPLSFKDEIENLEFRMQLDNAMLNLCYGQLFMVEQDINWAERKTECKPPRSYLMGYIRMIHSGGKEIDRLLWSATRNPPPKRLREDYRCNENY
jgi:hypothetical protein